MALLGNGAARRLGLRAARGFGGHSPRRTAITAPEPSATHDAVVDWGLYQSGHRTSEASYADAVRRARAGDGFVWIGLHEPSEDELAGIASDFALHPLAVEDAVHAHQRPKLDRYDELLFMVFKTVRYCPHEEVTESSQIVETGEVMVFLGHHFVVTVRHGDHGGLQSVRRRLEADRELLSRGPSAVLYGIADFIVDTYLEVTALLQDDVDEIEEQVFSDRRGRDIERIYQAKRELLELRRAVAPLTLPLSVLAERTIPVVDGEVRNYFRDVDDHLTRARDQVGAYDELLTSIVQASLAQLSMTANEDMRKITAWAAIIAVPTALAGIWGMNFDYMPETSWRFGYPVAILLIAGLMIVLHRGFKRNGWL